MSFPTAIPFCSGLIFGLVGARICAVFVSVYFLSMISGQTRFVFVPRKTATHFSGSCSFPHPIVAPVALPAGQLAVAKQQIEPMTLRKQSAAADVAEGQIGFIAGTAINIME